MPTRTREQINNLHRAEREAWIALQGARAAGSISVYAANEHVRTIRRRADEYVRAFAAWAAAMKESP